MSNYLNIIKTAILFFPLIAFILSIPYILYNYRKYGSIPYLKSFIFYTFILYLLIAYFLVILPLPTQDYVNNLTTKRIQPIPFKFIYDFIKESNLNILKLDTYLKAIKHQTFYVPIYNIFLTIPFAIYIKYYRNSNLKKTLTSTFLLSLFFEITQLTGLYFIYSRGYRLFDIDDLILNTFGGLLGYYLSIPILKKIPNFNEIKELAKEKGIKKVSRYRQTTAIILDIFIYTLLLFIITTRINIKHLYLYIAIIYYFIIPIILKGSTLGEKFLKIKIISKNNKHNIIKIILRKLLFIIFYILILIIPSIVYIKLASKLITRTKIIIILILFGFYFIYYSIVIIKYFFLKKEMNYEKISNTKIISTIK